MKYYSNKNGSVTMYNGDCLEVMNRLIENNIKVDCVLTDIPQEITQNKWDKGVDLSLMWDALLKIRKNKSTPIILFSNQPYTSKLIMSNIKMFKYCKYWQKDRPSNFLNAKKQPLRDIEDIVVFYEKQCCYNPQMWDGEPLHGMGHKFKDAESKNSNYNRFDSTNNPSAMREGDTKKFPRQLMVYPRPHPPIHPTQKPIELLEDLIKTYTNEGDVILDFTAGSFSTGVACVKLNRKFIGIELDEGYFDVGVKRIKNNS